MSSSRRTAYSPRELLGLLSDIEQRSQQSARSQSNIALPQHLWQGLVFTVSGVRLTCAMNEVSEMLALPDAMTRVPGTKDWLVGLANVRGNLLPVVDLQAYLGEKPVVPSKTSRILVLRRGQLLTGLLVPSVLGMRQFDVQYRLQNARIEGAIGAYVYDAFQQGQELWPVFSMRALAADPQFRSAGV